MQQAWALVELSRFGEWMAPDICITTRAACYRRSVRRQTYARRRGAHHSRMKWIMPMRRLPTLAFLATFLPSLMWLAPASAQAPGAVATPGRAQAERNAVDLKQGMTLDEVQQLLGKPQRTALKSNGATSSAPGQGTLQWTYVWNSAGLSSFSERTLSVEFAAKGADQWFVSGWGWGTY